MVGAGKSRSARALRLTALPFCLCALFAKPLAAQDEMNFVEANILGVFYHELGHAVIHTEAVPIFGQEEDAADVFSIFIIDALFEEDLAQSIALDATLGFWGEALIRDAEVEEIAWWDVHGPDEQRSYNTACVFYGADPSARGAFARAVDLPEERAEYCADEYDQARESWGMIIDGMTDTEARPALTFSGDEGSAISAVIESEVALLNAELRLAKPVQVVVESCDEANAFYDPEAYRITVCTEFEDHLRRIESVLE